MIIVRILDVADGDRFERAPLPHAQPEHAAPAVEQQRCTVRGPVGRLNQVARLEQHPVGSVQPIDDPQLREASRHAAKRPPGHRLLRGDPDPAAAVFIHHRVHSMPDGIARSRGPSPRIRQGSL
jgi:hypothetical protein